MRRSVTSAKAGVLSFKPRWAAIVLILVLGMLPALVQASTGARGDSARRGAEWLVSHQHPNGAFFDDSQRVDGTADILAAVVAAGVGGDPVARALSYVRENGEAGATRGAFTGRIIAGIVAGGGDPRDFGGVDYVAILDGQYDESTGAYDFDGSGFSFFPNLVAANGAVAAHGSLPEKAVDYIKLNECPGGGFGFAEACTFGADTDTTAWAINVLVAAGLASDDAVADAREFLLSIQSADGGFGYSADFPESSGDSTGLALSAINALGEDAQAPPWKRADGSNPVDALMSFQDPSGGFRFSASDDEPNGFSTTNAVPGMAGASYPVPALAEEPEPPPATTPPATPPPTEGATPQPTESPSFEEDPPPAHNDDGDPGLPPMEFMDDPVPAPSSPTAAPATSRTSGPTTASQSATPLPQIPTRSPPVAGGGPQAFRPDARDTTQPAQRSVSATVWAISGFLVAVGGLGVGIAGRALHNRVRSR